MVLQAVVSMNVSGRCSEAGRCLDIWLLMGLALLILSSGIGLRDPWPADEPRFALIAKEMVQSGQWLIPYRAGELYADKPPVFMWMIAAFYWLTGSMRLSFLLPSLLASLGTLLLVYDLGRRLWNRRVGLCAGFALLVSIQFVLQGKTAQIDALLCFWTTLGLYGLLRHLVLGPAWTWYLTGFGAMGLGVITKGVGFLPLLVFLPYLFVLKMDLLKPPGWNTTLLWLSGPLVMLLAIGLWVVPMWLYVDASGSAALQAYRDNLLFHQTINRYTDAWHHHKPGWYLFREALWLWLPLVLLLPWLLPAWWRRLKRLDVRYLLLVGWIAAVFLFFSLSAGKRGVYILPALPAFALAAAPLLTGLARRSLVKKVMRWFATALAVSLIVLSLFLMSQQLGEELVAAERWIMAFSILLLAITVLVAHVPFRSWTGLRSVALSLWSLWLVISWVGFPVLNSVRSPREFMAEVASHLGESDELAIVDWREQYLLFADRPVKHFGYHADWHEEVRAGQRWVRENDNRWLMLDGNALDHLCDGPEEALDLGVRHRHHWFLVNRAMLQQGCDPVVANKDESGPAGKGSPM